jgi:prepilin-type N-terminal cleavage/methylation domain-containing protein
MRRRCLHGRGLTLLEIVVALVILAIGVVAMNATLVLATRMVGHAFRLTQTSEAASTAIEWLRTCPGDAGDTIVGLAAVRWTIDTGPDLPVLRLTVVPTQGTQAGRELHFTAIPACQ